MKGFFYTVGCNEVHELIEGESSIPKSLNLADSLTESIELALEMLSEAKVVTEGLHWATVSFKVNSNTEGRLLICNK